MIELSKEQIEQTALLIEQAKHLVILTHMSPDGDAMGSSLGLYHWLIQHGKDDVQVIVPNAFPEFLHWMPQADKVLVYEAQQEAAKNALNGCDLVLCTDFNEPKRIGALGDILLSTVERGCPSILVDHHLNPLPFATVTLSYPTSPSACEIMYHWLTALNQHLSYTDDLTLDGATCLYTGMMTDTGNFSFNSNRPDSYTIIAHLVSLGVDKDAIYNHVFNAYSVDRMRLMGYCLYQKMRIFPEHHTALIYLSGKELYRFNFQSGDAEGIVNLPLQIKDIYYSCFMREDKVGLSEVSLANGSKKKIKISLRSQGNRPVNGLAHDIFGGGGHMNASGGEYYGPLAEAVTRFIEAYPSYFETK